MRAKSLNILKTVDFRIMKRELGKIMFCACFFPHPLTAEQREDRVISWQDIMAMADVEKCIFDKIITGDGTSCFVYYPENSDRHLKVFVRHSLGPRN
jgi:hypothetical protein